LLAIHKGNWGKKRSNTKNNSLKNRNGTLGLEPAFHQFLTNRFNGRATATAARPLTSYKIQYFGTTDHAKSNISVFQKIFIFLENIYIC